MDNISVGIALFNDGDFFSAHDFFEDCWIECEREERSFYQGMVQVSVGSYHLISGNYKGCVSQYKKAIKKLVKYQPSYKKINLDLLLKSVDEIAQDLTENSKNVDAKKFWNRIPRIYVTK